MLNPGLLAVVRAEIHDHETALVKLREIERLTLELAPAAPPPATLPAPAPRRSLTPARAKGAKPTREERAELRQGLVSLLATRGPLSPAQIAESSGLPIQTVRHYLRGLAEEHRVQAHGATSNRTYDVAHTNGNGQAPKQLPAPPRFAEEVERAAELERAAGEPVALEDRVLAIVTSTGGRVALSEVEYQLHKVRLGGTEHLVFNRAELEKAVGRLTVHGVLIRDEGGGLRLGERPLVDVALDVAGGDEL